MVVIENHLIISLKYFENLALRNFLDIILHRNEMNSWKFHIFIFFFNVAKFLYVHDFLIK